MKQLHRYREAVVAFFCAVLFGVSLVVSGMTQPDKIVGFLDFTGFWDASVLVVVLCAVPTYFALFRLARKRSKPMLGEKFDLPQKKSLDWKLIVGAALFGTGWGMAGFCPGPALVSLGAGSESALIFCAGMFVGMLAFRAFEIYERNKAHRTQG